MAGIRKWHLKAIVQKGLSFLPFGSNINFWFQKHITRGVRLTDAYINDRLIHARDHLAYFRQYGGEFNSTLEIGTGWYPIIPLLFYLQGALQVYTLDVRRYMTRKRFTECARKLIGLHDEGRLSAFVHVHQGRLDKLKEILDSPALEGMLSTLSIHYVIGDARSTGLPASYFDLVHSNNTLEHIPKEILKSILVETNRVGKGGCIHSHFIDMSDHFAHMDRSITPYNFLKFSTKRWRWINNSIQFMNRLRLPDYRKLFRQSGFHIVHEQLRADSPDDLDTVKVHQEFEEHHLEDLRVTHVHFVCRSGE